MAIVQYHGSFSLILQQSKLHRRGGVPPHVRNTLPLASARDQASLIADFHTHFSPSVILITFFFKDKTSSIASFEAQRRMVGILCDIVL